MSEALQMAEMLSKSIMVPKAYQGKPQDTLVAMMMGNEVGLNPIQSLQNIAVINGKPSIYGDALAALVQNHPAFGGMEESFNESGNVATCIVWRRGGSKHTQTFSEADARKASLWDKAGPWKQYPKRMLAMRARGFALRSQFADALAGLITREEAGDMPLQDYEPPTAISGPIDPLGLTAITGAETMEALQAAFALAWRSNTDKDSRAQLTRAKDARKAELNSAVIEGEAHATAE
jgi:hypothetical protein